MKSRIDVERQNDLICLTVNIIFSGTEEWRPLCTIKLTEEEAMSLTDQINRALIYHAK